MHQGKDGGGRANTQRQCENRRDREYRSFAQSAQCVARVVCQMLQPQPAARLVEALSRAGKVPEIAPGFAVGIRTA